MKTRAKKSIPAMLPIKKWLSKAEAMSYLDMSVNKFNDLITKEGLTVAEIGNKTYYRVEQLDEIFLRKIIINHA